MRSFIAIILLAFALCTTARPTSLTLLRMVSSTNRPTTPQPTTTNTRKAHANKYAQFSKKEVDPLRAAMEKQQQTDAELQRQVAAAAPTRGTTVPIPVASFKAAAVAAATNITNATPALDIAPATLKPLTFSNASAVVPADPYTFGYTQIGVIGVPHGVKGEVKMLIESDFADARLGAGQIVHVRRPNRRTPRPIRVERGRRQAGDTFLVQFEGVGSRLAAVVFRGYAVYVRADDRPALRTDEYLVRDLVGLRCFVYADAEAPVAAPAAAVASGGGGGGSGGGGDAPRTLMRRLKKGKAAAASVSASAPAPSSVAAEAGQRLARRVGVVVGVVPPDELCGPAAAKLMHAMLEIRLARSPGPPTRYALSGPYLTSYLASV